MIRPLIPLPAVPLLASVLLIFSVSEGVVIPQTLTLIGIISWFLLLRPSRYFVIFKKGGWGFYALLGIVFVVVWLSVCLSLFWFFSLIFSFFLHSLFLHFFISLYRHFFISFSHTFCYFQMFLICSCPLICLVFHSSISYLVPFQFSIFSLFFLHDHFFSH